MFPGPGEPPAAPWRVERLGAFARWLAGAAGNPTRPRIIAVDGRGGGGKTTLADRLRRQLPGAAVVHTDDVAWNHSRFGWDDLMRTGILEPLHAGRAVHYQPPAWPGHGRTGHIDIPATAPVVILEGVGASRREVAHLIDVAVWLQSDYADARRRGVRRDAAEQGLTHDEALRLWEEWEAEEVPFLLEDRPWERADVIAGSPPEPAHDPEAEVLLAPPLPA